LPHNYVTDNHNYLH